MIDATRNRPRGPIKRDVATATHGKHTYGSSRAAGWLTGRRSLVALATCNLLPSFRFPIPDFHLTLELMMDGAHKKEEDRGSLDFFIRGLLPEPVEAVKVET